MFFTFRVYDIQSTFSISASCNNFRTKDTLSNFKITLLFPFFDDQMSGIYFNSNKPIDNEPPDIKNNSKNPTNKSINYVIRNIAYNHSNKDSSKNPIKSIQHNSVKLWLKDLFHYCNFSRLNTHPKNMERREKIKSNKKLQKSESKLSTFSQRESNHHNQNHIHKRNSQRNPKRSLHLLQKHHYHKIERSKNHTHYKTWSHSFHKICLLCFCKLFLRHFPH